VEEQQTAPAAEQAPVKKSSNKTLWIVLAVVGVFVILPALALGLGLTYVKSRLSSENVAETLIERASGGNVDIDSSGKSFTIEGKNGESLAFGSDQKLPDDFPKSKIPFLKEKSVVFTLNSTNDNKKTWSVTTTVDSSFEDAKKYFETEIKEPAYSDVSSFGFGESQTYYGKSSGYDVSVTVSQVSDSKDTNVSYIVTEN
jgi:hypothetical protein